MFRKSSLQLIFLVLLSSGIFSATHKIAGRVINMHNGDGIPGAEVFSNSVGTITDNSGYYSLDIYYADSITVRCMGFETLHTHSSQNIENIVLKPGILQGQTITIAASRVIPGVTPVAYSVLDAEEIRMRYNVEDVPMILSSEAGVHAYSESGNGTGYSYVSIRGFDQSRISVMIDNVPLNDNESHQVYWVDHGDILSNAENVEIQRGVGNSLYGASAFGGSININTAIRSAEEQFNLGVSAGSFATEKYRIEYKSGNRMGENLSLIVRASILNSDGYRVDSRSEQTSLMFALEHRKSGLTNQFRSILGKEFSVLQWDGVSQEYLDDVDLRRDKMSWTVPFTDDYFQQIHSLNTHYYLNQHSVLTNVAYLVVGTGFYEVQKIGQDFYTYNLDIQNSYHDTTEQLLETDFWRRKWINNYYYGITPVWTYESKMWRSDLGIELRSYTGDHFGEVRDVSDSSLAAILPNPYEYYSYKGQKRLFTAFGHFLLRFTPRLSGSLDLRAQNIDWQLDQEPIGHAQGVNLGADWQFVNPRIGIRYELMKGLSIFSGIGIAQKEPADAQIIEADDVWSTPTIAPSEAVQNIETGINWYAGDHQLAINIYRIKYENQLLSDIYDFQDGSFTLETADLTVHQGMEFEIRSQLNQKFHLNLNGSIAEHRLQDNDLKGKHLKNVPGILANGQIQYAVRRNIKSSFSLKYVGKQYIDELNTEDIAIPAYLLSDIALNIKYLDANLQFRMNNCFDIQYATFGYEYYGGYYWPGANRNISVSVNYSF